ncbi:hypothetical protein ZHAS_00019607 [Anopheles sinensis]|uniref:Uncharacterized protein n=1 Tax=Anopheles sinensis TaxID=74873 RepID=A0A084WMU9_ANOSI|nr:hypothetical protein ZHAS_00019607 [Anopheles sinensis]
MRSNPGSKRAPDNRPFSFFTTENKQTISTNWLPEGEAKLGPGGRENLAAWHLRGVDKIAVDLDHRSPRASYGNGNPFPLELTCRSGWRDNDIEFLVNASPCHMPNDDDDDDGDSDESL